MKHRLIPRILAVIPLALSLASAPAQQKNPDDLSNDPGFTNLPKAQRDAFVEHVNKAARLFAEKRIFEVLDELGKAEAIFPKSVAALNLKGSCYVEFRDFKRAREFYEEALKLSPESTSVRFNIAEVEFCIKDWQAAHDSFTKLLADIPEEQAAMKRLVEFKILLCKLKVGQVEAARKMADNHGFLDDSPYHFFAMAALAFHAEDPVAAEEWLARAVRIFQRPEVLAPWQDTLIEFGYIKSFYGGDLGEE